MFMQGNPRVRRLSVFLKDQTMHIDDNFESPMLPQISKYPLLWIPKLMGWKMYFRP